MNPSVSILVLTHNRIALSMQCIPYLLDRIGNVDAELLIWDNASKDGTLDWLCEFAKCTKIKTEVFCSEENHGVEAINFLAKEASGEYILKVDDDIMVPHRFAERLISAYTYVNDNRLAFLGWDMPWTNGNSFATRSGKKLYEEPLGRTVAYKNKETIYIHHDPSKWLINGACRLSRKDKFFEIGGHPPGVLYGADALISKQAAKKSYFIGYYSPSDLLDHRGRHDTPAYRMFKNEQLLKNGCPIHV